MTLYDYGVFFAARKAATPLISSSWSAYPQMKMGRFFSRNAGATFERCRH